MFSLVAYKVVLGLDFIGNPVKFLGHVSTGMQALYYEPFLEGLQSMASNTLGGYACFVLALCFAQCICCFSWSHRRCD